MSDEQESRELKLAPELVAVQNKLANLTPKALRTDRDQLMFNAGRASASRVVRSAELVECPDPVRAKPSQSAVSNFWPTATAAMAAATILLSAMLLRQSPPLSMAHKTATPQTTTVVAAATASSKPTFTRTWISPPTTGYLGARNIALSRGVSALATEFDVNIPATSKRPEPATARELREELLPTTPRQRG